MKPYCLLSLIFLFFCCKSQTDSETEKQENVDDIIAQVASEYQIHGLSIAIVLPGTKSLTINHGHTNEMATQKITDTTLFSAQSISKIFTSLACLHAVGEGLIELDTPITDYIRSFKVNSFHEEDAASKITIRHLLSHTSGLPPDAPVGNIFSAQFKGDVYAPLDQRVDSAKDIWLRHEVGTRYSYSNIAFDIVARIVEISSQKSFHEYVREKVLAPLQMNYSTFNLDLIPNQSDVAQGYCYQTEGRIPVKFSSLGAGGLYTCAKDMTNFLCSAMKGFPEILEEELYHELTLVPFSNEKNGYALGLTVNDIQHCTPALGHTGNGFGFTSLIHWIPEFEIGVVVLSNRESAYTGLQRIQQSILSRDIPFDQIDLSCQNLSKLKKRFNEEESKYYQQISGAYSNGNVTLTFETRDSLFGVLAPDDGSFKTIHFLSKNSWLIEDNEIILFSYKNGQIINQNNGMSFEKIKIRPTKGKNRDWDRYTGRYHSYAYGMIESIEVIDVEDGRLRLNGISLREHYPDLFFDQYGQIVDFRNDQVQIEYGEYIKIE